MPQPRIHATASARMRAYRARQAGRRIEVTLSPDASAALDRIAPAGGGIKPTIERLIIEADKGAP